MFKQLQKVNQLKIYYLLEILLAIGGTFTHTTYYIYLTTTLGFSNAQAMFLDTILFIAIFFFEVPTGIIGDKYGRKFSFLVGRSILGLSFLMYFVTGNYVILAFGSVLFALGMAFESGSFEAWIVDQVDKTQRSTIFVTRDVIRKLSVIIIPLISVFIAETTSYGFPYFVSFTLAIITVIIGVLFMKENLGDEKKEINEKKGLESLLGIGLSSVKNVLDQSNLRVFFLSVLLTAFAGIAINSYSSKLVEITLGSKYIGLIISLSSLASITFTLLLNKFKLLQKSYLILGLLAGLSLIVIGFNPVPLLIIIVFIIQVVALASFDIQRQTQINNNIDKNRATVLSVFSFAGSISGVIGTLIFGYLADKISINFTFAVAGFAVLIAILPLIRISRNLNLSKDSN